MGTLSTRCQPIGGWQTSIFHEGEQITSLSLVARQKSQRAWILLAPRVKADWLLWSTPPAPPVFDHIAIPDGHDHGVAVLAVITFGCTESVAFGSTNTQERLKKGVTLLKF